MKRKIIKLAEKTLVVSLPTEWVSTQHLEKGDELECSVSDTSLVITPPVKKSSKKIEIDITDVSERVLRWQISSLHKQGYDEIIIVHYDEAQYAILQDLVDHLFLGFIVKEKTSLRLVIGEVTVADVKEFDAMLRRSFRQLLVGFDELVKGNYKELLQLEFDNNKQTNFCERLLNKYLLQKEKGHFWYVIAWNIEKVVDNFKYMAELEVKVEKELCQGVKEFAQGYYDCFYDFDYEKLVVLSEKKKELEAACTELMKTNAAFAHYMHMMILQIADFSASMIALKA